MKKLISIVLVLTLMTVSLFSCNFAARQFTGEWKFSKVSKVELAPECKNLVFDTLKQKYNTEDEAEIVSKALDEFVAEKTFENFYLKFEGQNTYTYDPFMDREATWRFYQTGENEGFISFYTELDPSEGNTDPLNYPDLVYQADSDTMYIVVHDYFAFMITLELTR